MRIVRERTEKKNVPVVSVITRVARPNMGLQGLTIKLEWSCANQLLLFLTHLNISFNYAILWTDHEKHPLMLWVSFKELGIILFIYGLLDRRIATFGIIIVLLDKRDNGLSPI